MPTLINILGTGRCGSTLLDVMLGNAPDAFSCGEVFAYFRPHRTHHFDPRCPCNQHPCPVWERLKRFPARTFHGRACKALGVEFLVDSSKDLCWVADNNRWAVASGLKVVNLVLWKEPASLAHSYHKRGRDPEAWRRDFVAYYTRFFDLRLPFRSVCFDELTRDVPRLLAAVCRAASMPYFEGKERFWDKQHHHLFGSGGVRKMVAERRGDIRQPQQLAGDVAAEQRVPGGMPAAGGSLGEVLRRMRKVDVSSDAVAAEDASVGGSLPLWYYKRRATLFVRRLLPERWVTEQVPAEPARP